MTILSMQQAARYLGKTDLALQHGYKRWAVPHFRLGGQIKFTRESLDQWIAGRMVSGREATPR